MYEAFYGFIKEPFNITPDPKFLYLSDSHEEGLAHLLYGVERKKGLIVLTGEIGTGKTTLLNSLVHRLDERTHVAFLVDSQVTLMDIFQCLFSEFGLEVKGRTKGEFLIELKSFLLRCSKSEEKSILIIDEAQNLSLDVLEGLRLLTNFETAKEKLIQILLVGQPVLDDKLSLPELAQLKQRIGISFRLLPLNYYETKGYIDNRLTIAGATYPIFTVEAVDAIYRYSRGIPRLINIMCDLALFFGVSDKQREIGRAIIRQVAESLNYKLEEKEDQNRKKEKGIDRADAVVIKQARDPIIQDFLEMSRDPEGSVESSEGRVVQKRDGVWHRFRRPGRRAAIVVIMLGIVFGSMQAQKIEGVRAAIETFSQSVLQCYTAEKSSTPKTIPPSVHMHAEIKQPLEHPFPSMSEPLSQTVTKEDRISRILPLIDTGIETKQPAENLWSRKIEPRREQLATFIRCIHSRDTTYREKKL